METIEEHRQLVYDAAVSPSRDDSGEADMDGWLSTQAAAKRLGVTPRTLYRFIDQGELPAYRMGRVIRLKTSEVDAYIESTRIQPGSLEHLYPDAKR
jgi:excisionase family DNA binding protein